MIKTWHKWFICIFAIVFVSMFFVIDSMQTTSRIPQTDIVVDGDDGNKENPENPDVPTVPDPKEEEPTEAVPKYRDGYTCLKDAYQKFDDTLYYTYLSQTSASSSGINQTIKVINKYSDGLFCNESFVYCDSSIGARFYERCYSYDKETITTINTDNINSSLHYTISGGDYSSTVPYEEMIDQVMLLRLNPLKYRAVKGRDKQIKFDKNSDSNYYLISIMFDLSVLTDVYIQQIKDNVGTDTVDYQSIVVNYYVSKKTGKISKFVVTEKYKIEVIGLKFEVTYVNSAAITYYSQPIDVTAEE